MKLYSVADNVTDACCITTLPNEFWTQGKRARQRVLCALSPWHCWSTLKLKVIRRSKFSVTGGKCC